MLSSKKLPAPRDEVRFHARRCREHGETYLATTRTIEGLTPGGSVIALYGDSPLKNAYLGQGIYLDYILLSTPGAWELLEGLGLYAANQYPDNTIALIKLREVVTGKETDRLELLNGTIQKTGEALTARSLPSHQSRVQIYYTTP
jgi:hypothetical protein